MAVPLLQESDMEDLEFSLLDVAGNPEIIRALEGSMSKFSVLKFPELLP